MTTQGQQPAVQADNGTTEHCEHSVLHNFDCANDCGGNGCLYLRWSKSFAEFNQARLDAIKQRVISEQKSGNSAASG